MQSTLRKLQLVELDILRAIDSFCTQHNIHYSLYAGTLLGAIRHQGFIPWDDDLDICMSRSEYDRFIMLWKQSAPQGYVLQNKENSPGFTQSFTKIRKDHTAFYQEGEIPGNYHIGIFVDVFPIDRIPNGWFKRKLFLFRGMKYQLFTREFSPNQNGLFIKIVSKLLLCMMPKRYRRHKRNKLLQKITRNNHNKDLHTVAIEILSTLRMPLPPDLMDDFVDIIFEGESFKCTKRWKEYLTLKFGDYMQFPPEEERTWTHHPIVLDFEHNYEELNPQ